MSVTAARYNLLLRKRGVYRLGPASIESGDLFGIFEQIDPNGPVDYLTVFPETLPFQTLQLPSGDPFGDRRARRRLYEDPNQPMGVRDYHPEDDFRRIHWPATAHTGDLQVKVYQPISARMLVVCLNVLTLKHYWEGTNPGIARISGQSDCHHHPAGSGRWLPGGSGVQWLPVACRPAVPGASRTLDQPSGYPVNRPGERHPICHRQFRPLSDLRNAASALWRYAFCDHSFNR